MLGPREPSSKLGKHLSFMPVEASTGKTFYLFLSRGWEKRGWPDCFVVALAQNRSA